MARHMNVNLTPQAHIITSTFGYSVQTHWVAEGIDLDRPHTRSFNVGSDRRLAERLAAAIDAGDFWHDAEVHDDVDGNTYVRATAASTGRYLNTHLGRMGY